MTTAQDLFKASKLSREEMAHSPQEKKRLKLLLDMARIDTMREERVDIPPSEGLTSPTGKNAYRIYLKFYDGSMMAVLIDPYGDAVAFDAYNPVSQ